MTVRKSERKAIPALAEAWAHLRHGGLLIAPARLPEFFPAPPAPLPEHIEDNLRGAVTRVQSDNDDANHVLDVVLERALGLKAEAWVKGTAVDATWTRRSVTGESIKPRRVWLNHDSNPLPVFWANSAEVKRLGVGRGKRATSRVLEWLRGSDQKIALLTNGRQWRVMYAGSDHDAWAEADVDSWFEEGEAAAQLHALRALISPAALTNTAGRPSPLLEAIQASRRGQAEVSSVLGERVRRAVELLIRAYAPAIDVMQSDDATKVEPRDLYLAASRIVMRNVVVLFAESREGLLPVDSPVYFQAYSLQGLREQLERMPPHALRDSRSAWPRVLALFNLMREGSPHPALTVPRYGGGLFTRGDPASPDPVLRALSAFEDTMASPTDDVVSRILRLLTRTKTRVRQGRSSIMVDTPVDFSDLGTEYIGIIYEGLLDFELRKTSADTPVVFLNLGKQPALPLDRLEAMSAKQLKDLLQQLKKEKAGTEEDEDETAEEATEDDSGKGEEEEAEQESDGDAETEDDTDEASEETEDRDALERVKAWAGRAVVTAGLVDKRGRRQPDTEQVEAAARALVKQVIPPDRWFLVRWGGTRKGSGTFYTRPALAAPTIRRTLETLVYERREDGSVAPRAPEEILRLKVCDPSMGSGSFLAGALRYLTSALYQSLHHHDRIKQHGPNTLCRLADGGATNNVVEETLPLPPDHPDFEERLVARLKRHVVERCLYGVDYDPLAVELARVALWIETMDRNLPFEFLDHKLKGGNSLVGTWLDQFRDYPVMAWARDGGDSNHKNFVHHFRLNNRGKPAGDLWTATIKEKAQVVKAEMVRVISSRSGVQAFAFMDTPIVIEDLHREAVDVFERLERVPPFDTEERARVYREEFLGDPELQKLKLALDTWCSVWFWPAEHLDAAPMPSNFHSPPEETLALVQELAAQHRFFHWEMEFPDVFTSDRAGFDAIIGNPPWEIQKPNSREFFSNKDPLYRGYGKQAALSRQKELFSDPSTEEEWLRYNARLKAMNNWVAAAGIPFGDGEPAFSLARGKDNSRYHEMWRRKRGSNQGFADSAHPFRHQGSADVNTYKLFLELSHALTKQGGRVGMIVPSGIYSDKGSKQLRQLFLDECEWEWLFAFENRDKIFDIDSRFKFCPVIVTKGGETTSIRAAFMRRDPHDWEHAEDHEVQLLRSQVEDFSPITLAILEVQNELDLKALKQIYETGVTMGNASPDSWQLGYAREFDSTNDSRLFPPRETWEQRGYRPDAYGHWLKGEWQQVRPAELTDVAARLLSMDGKYALSLDAVEDVALPMYQGVMIHQFDPCFKGWTEDAEGKTTWEVPPPDQRVLRPKYLMSRSTYLESQKPVRGYKIAYRRIARNTDTRTWIGAVTNDLPSTDSVFFLVPRDQSSAQQTSMRAAALLNSFAFDWQLRVRLGGTNISWFVLEETALPQGRGELDALELTALKLMGTTVRHAPEWLAAAVTHPSLRHSPWRQHWALTPHERVRLRAILDALAAHAYGLTADDLAWILRDCDLPMEELARRDAEKALDPKGFWRVDKDREPELRHTVLAQVAFHDLQAMGLDKFLNQNDGEGWMLPECVRLADYGLGHDERAKQLQTVAVALGERHYAWQLDQDAETSWHECEMHGRNIRAIMGTRHTQATSSSGPVDMFGNEVETDMFGNPLPARKRK